jgi:hypothetical protein
MKTEDVPEIVTILPGAGRTLPSRALKQER